MVQKISDLEFHLNTIKTLRAERAKDRANNAAIVPDLLAVYIGLETGQGSIPHILSILRSAIARLKVKA